MCAQPAVEQRTQRHEQRGADRNGDRETPREAGRGHATHAPAAAAVAAHANAPLPSVPADRVGERAPRAAPACSTAPQHR